jgi:hypothetical protein
MDGGRGLLLLQKGSWLEGAGVILRSVSGSFSVAFAVSRWNKCDCLVRFKNSLA